MREILFRCSSLGRLMTAPKTQKEGPLSAGARAYIRELAQQEIFSVDFEFGSKETEKGIEVEDESIALLNRVRGLSLAKNTERRDDGVLTGECDLYDAERNRGHDLKSSWSVKTFPGWLQDCGSDIYEWQCRGYMRLWDADEWEVNYALVNTPERLIRFEPLQMHIVDHIPEHLRLTTLLIERCHEKEREIEIKLAAARAYYDEAIGSFDRLHARGQVQSRPTPATAKLKTTQAPPALPSIHLPDLF